MFQRFFIITILLAVLLQVCGRSWAVLYYELNKEYIAKNLCENRDKPELKCHGKCKLMKAMAALEQKDQSKENSQSNSVPNYLQEFFFTEKINFLPKFTFQDFSFQENTKQLFFFKHSCKDAYLASSWHPPTTLI